MLYRNLSGYLREKYGKRMGKICIDGGFSCPNRDGKCGVGGCIFCGERGAGEHIDPLKSISDQVRSALTDASDDDIFIAYFQNFTNTYAAPDVLRERYDSALIDKRIRVLAIGTRPDCIDDDICRLLAEYKDKIDIWVELGLQTANDYTAKLINRGYSRDVFERAMRLLEKYGIPVCVHLIVGLPGESISDIENTCDYLSHFPIYGIKIHSIYVMQGTKLAEMYYRGEYTPPTLGEYVESAVRILTRISPLTVVHRLTGDCPTDMLVAPDWNRNKHAVIDAIVNRMAIMGYEQGCHFKKQN